MITLPPGCSVAYGITIDIDSLTDEMVEWYKLIEGTITTKAHWTRSKQVDQIHVAYGGGKPCHYMQDGTNGVRLHFLGKDVGAASMFLIKFNEHVRQHNLKRMEENVY